MNSTLNFKIYVMLEVTVYSLKAFKNWLELARTNFNIFASFKT